MPDTTAVQGSAPRRNGVIVGLVLVATLAVAVGAAVIWRRTRTGPAGDGSFGLLPVLRHTTGELGRGLMDGGAVSARFVSDLRAGRWHEAYQSTSRQFRQRMDEARFERFVRESPPIQSPDTPIKFNLLLLPEGSSVSVQGAETAPKGGVWLLLVDEEGTLKVERLSLSDRVTP